MSDRPADATGHRPRGSVAARPSSWRSAAAPAPRRWRWPRPNPTSTWWPSRSTGAGWPNCSARSTASTSPTSGWSAATGSTCSSTCSRPESLTGVRVFFPDPWPKSRHHKRRLLQPSTVALIADRLRPGGVLHAATDHAGYAEQIAEVGDAEPRLRRVDRGDGTCPSRCERPDHQIRDQGPARRQRGDRTGVGATRERDRQSHAGDAATTAPTRHRRVRRGRRPPGAAGLGRPQPRHGPGRPSSAAGRPRRTGRVSTRWAAGCWPAPPKSRRRWRESRRAGHLGGARSHRVHQHRTR